MPKSRQGLPIVNDHGAAWAVIGKPSPTSNNVAASVAERFNSLCRSSCQLYSGTVLACAECQTVTEVVPGRQRISCSLADGSMLQLPAFLGPFIRRGDLLRMLAPGNTRLLIKRPRPQQQSCLIYSIIGYVGQARLSENGDRFLARAELPECSTGLTALFLSGNAIRQYFYSLGDSRVASELYAVLGVPETATPTDLRTAWRVRHLESRLQTANSVHRVWVERAFNVLAYPDLRTCYDALRRDEDAPPVFPYGGFGSIVVEGRVSNNGDAFFADRILAYKPDMCSRKVSLLLRQCEFLADHVICQDRRRKLEVLLDAGLLPGVSWDLTWNQWKHWLTSRIDVEATFVRTGKYRFRDGEWILRSCHTALPSRLRVTLPDGIAADVERARAIHELLGEHADVIERIRAEIENQPTDHVQVQSWFDRLGVSFHLRPQHVNWRPDYQPYYFEQLREGSQTWCLFRDEYLFLWANVLITEIPQMGHATYVFAKPPNLDTFMRRYSQATREDLRCNRNNVASDLGFVGRVVRGSNKKRWLNQVLKLAGEKGDYLEVFE